jgi:hypothetical protein
MAVTASSINSLKAAVIVPPICDFYFTPHRFSCLGAKIVYQILLEMRINTVLFNFPLNQQQYQLADLPKDINYLKEYIVPNEIGKLSFFTKYKWFGPNINSCVNQILSFNPDICFFSCFAFSYSQQLFDIADELKKTSPQIIIVVGGAGVSAYPLYFVRRNSIDFAITGEAEISLKDFIMATFFKKIPFENIPNLFWKKNGNIFESKIKKFTLSQEMHPIIEKVFETSKNIFYSTYMSRGCSKSCQFCSAFLSFGKSFRTINYESFINSFYKTFSYIKDTPQKTIYINFEDDNFLINQKFLIDILEKIKNFSPNIKILAENGMDYLLLTPLLADKLISLGMSKFNFTFVSIKEELVYNQKRKSSIEHFEKIVNFISEKNVPVLSYLICGLEGDNKENVVETLLFLKNLRTGIGVSIFYPIPNIEKYKNTNFFDNFSPYVFNGSSAYPWTKSLSTCELITVFRLSRFINLLKYQKKSDEEKDIINKIISKKKLFTIIKEKNKHTIIEVPKYDKEMVKMFLDK